MKQTNKKYILTRYSLVVGLMLLFVEVMGLKDSIAYIPMAVISAVTNYLVIRTVVKYTKKKREKQQS